VALAQSLIQGAERCSAFLIELLLNQLATEIARLRGQLTPDAAKARAETEQQIEALRTELLALLDHPIEGAPHESERARERTRNSASSSS
jgi:hypothetical protein